ncbi:hypothetical protein QJS04_geneDACA008277 [Acorus gramineus]|uniref:DUF4283 domain-containing protein n=1 Tax=Acorus gramineus TaxID=55184 RepID=A0AAV9AW42_ACOGR|nr:hypothetical protein QJS04_geneDACA008277 [Acorus gramineus]
MPKISPGSIKAPVSNQGSSKFLGHSILDKGKGLLKGESSKAAAVDPPHQNMGHPQRQGSYSRRFGRSNPSTKLAAESKSWAQLFPTQVISHQDKWLSFIKPLLQDGKPVVPSEEADLVEMDAHWRLSLIGYVIGKKPYYKDFIEYLNRVWKPNGHLEVLMRGGDFFVNIFVSIRMEFSKKSKLSMSGNLLHVKLVTPLDIQRHNVFYLGDIKLKKTQSQLMPPKKYKKMLSTPKVGLRVYGSPLHTQRPKLPPYLMFHSKFHNPTFMALADVNEEVLISEDQFTAAPISDAMPLIMHGVVEVHSEETTSKAQSSSVEGRSSPTKVQPPTTEFGECFPLEVHLPELIIDLYEEPSHHVLPSTPLDIQGHKGKADPKSVTQTSGKPKSKELKPVGEELGSEEAHTSKNKRSRNHKSNDSDPTSKKSSKSASSVRSHGEDSSSIS